MENSPTLMLVVAAALSRGDGTWLMQRRREQTHHGGLWEFPGGKVEPAETLRMALVRELHEELDLAILRDRFRPLAFADSAVSGTGIPIVINLYTAALSDAEAGAIARHGAGGEADWFNPQQIAALPRPPLDVTLCEMIFAQRSA